MQLSAFLMLGFCLHLSASGLTQNITYHAENVKLTSVFQEVKKQTGYRIVADINLVKDKVVTVNASGQKLEDFLVNTLQSLALDFRIEGKTIFVHKQKENSGSVPLLPGILTEIPPITVRGRVVNENGEGIPGVTVSVKGTQKAAASDVSGFFVIENVQENGTLVFTGINVESREIRLSRNLDLSAVVLKTRISSEQEVIVTVNTGYQSLSKERSAGSFSKPDKEILLNRSTSMNILQRLDGLVPGLTVNNAPGAEGLLIRGLSSINASRAPLIVVDGIPISNINSINPQDVADVTVLKDATASSIWGSKASNGVIVITTKKGTANEKIKVNYNGFLSFQGKPDLDYLPMLNSQQYIQAAREVFDPVSYPWNTVSGNSLGSFGVPPHEMILYNESRGLISSAEANKSLDSLALINNRQQIKDLWYRNASLMNHTVSLSAGGKVYSLYGSLAFTDTKSNRPGAQDRTYKGNLRQDFNFNKHIRAYLITDITNSVASSRRNVMVDSRFYPYQLFQDANGNSVSMPYVGRLSDSTRQDVQARSRIGMDYKPLDDANLATNKTNILMNRIVGGVNVNLFKGLRYEGLFGYINRQNKTTLYDDNTSFVQRNEIVNFTVAPTLASTPVYYLPLTGGRYTASNIRQREWTVRNQLVFDRSWQGANHQATILVGHESQEQLFNTATTTLRGYSPQLLNAIPIDYKALALGVGNPVVANNFNRSVLPTDFYLESENQTRFNSYYTNAAYTFSHKYSVNASWRLDKSNLFGFEKAAQNKPVWSAGVKWMLGDEEFMQGVRSFDHLALRATYGVTGNAPTPGTASSYNILSSATATSLPGGRSFGISSPANPNLSWESTKTINFGLDFAILKSRISGSIDYYNKQTKNLIGQLPVNVLTGYSVIIGNYGDLKNNGIELNIRSLNIDSKNFDWTTQFNLAYNKNIITNINYSTPLTMGQQLLDQRFLPGYPAFSLFAYQYAGLDELGDPLIALSDKTITKNRNMAKPEDMRFMGTTQPPWSGGIANIFQYKSFSLSINAIFNLGHVMRRDVGSFFSGRLAANGDALVLRAGSYTSELNLTRGNVNAIFLERWKNPGDEQSTLVPSYVSNSSVSNSRRDINYYVYGDLNVLNASYIKIRDITLSYSLPKHLIGQLKSDNITFRAQISNLMLWKANKHGIDPEFQGFTLSDAFGGNPETINQVNRSMRTMQGIVTIGANVSF